MKPFYLNQLHSHLRGYSQGKIFDSIFFKKAVWLGAVAYTCNPSTLGGQGRQITWGQEFETSLANMVKSCFLVCSHAANEDIPDAGQFIKERGFIDSQFHMAGEASQSWWKARWSKSCLTWIALGNERDLVQGNSSLQNHQILWDLFTIMKTAWEKPTPMIQLPPTRSLSWHMGIMGSTIQDDIWVGTQPSHRSC